MVSRRDYHKGNTASNDKKKRGRHVGIDAPETSKKKNAPGHLFTFFGNQSAMEPWKANGLLGIEGDNYDPFIVICVIYEIRGLNFLLYQTGRFGIQRLGGCRPAFIS